MTIGLSAHSALPLADRRGDNEVDALPEQDVCVHKILAERRSPIYSCSEILRLWPARRSEVDMIFTATRVINSRVNAIRA